MSRCVVLSLNSITPTFPKLPRWTSRGSRHSGIWALLRNKSPTMLRITGSSSCVDSKTSRYYRLTDHGSLLLASRWFKFSRRIFDAATETTRVALTILWALYAVRTLCHGAPAESEAPRSRHQKRPGERCPPPQPTRGSAERRKLPAKNGFWWNSGSINAPVFRILVIYIGRNSKEKAECSKFWPHVVSGPLSSMQGPFSRPYW